MTLEEIDGFADEMLDAKETFDKHGVTLVPTSPSRPAYLARAIKMLLPVVRAVERWTETHRLPFTPDGCAEHRQSGADLVAAIDALRAALERP